MHFYLKEKNYFIDRDQPLIMLKINITLQIINFLLFLNKALLFM